MAVIAYHLTRENAAGGATSFNTASITPTANRLVIAVVYTIVAAGTPNTPTMTGNNLTWVQVATHNLSYDTKRRVTVFRAMGASPSSGVATIDFAGQSQSFAYWSITEFGGDIVTTGSNGANAVVQEAYAELNTTATGITVTLNAFAQSTNATFGVCIRNSATGATAGSGFTEVNQVTGGNGSVQSEFNAVADTSVDWTWGSENAAAQAIALELAVPSSAPTGNFAFL